MSGLNEFKIPVANCGKKKAYLKPEIICVPLRPEEAVLGSCKVAGETALTTNTCANSMCQFAGS